MDEKRLQKIDRLIQKQLSEMFLIETKKMRGVIVSITHVSVTPDLSEARVHLSVFPSEKMNDYVKSVNDNVKTVRYELGRRTGKQLRVIPELKFFPDDSLDYIENIDRILEKDKQKVAKRDEEIRKNLN